MFQDDRMTSKNVKKNFFDFDEDETELYLSIEGDVKQSNNVQDERKASTLALNSLSPSATSKPKPISSSSRQPSNLLLELRPEQAERKVTELLATLSLNKQPQTGLSSPSRSSNLTTRLAIERLLDGDINVNLSPFRAKEQKLELLDYSLISVNTYVITKVIIFLRETLKSSLFFYEISRRPVAANHYLIYLRNTEQFEELLNGMALLRRNEEAAFAQYARAIDPNTAKDGGSQIRALKRALQSFTSGESDVQQWQGYIQEQIALLEQQLPIEADDARREAEERRREALGEAMRGPPSPFLLHSRPNLVGLPVLDTLAYCCIYHYDLQANNFASPGYVNKKFALNERQFLYTTMHALAKVGAWMEVDSLFEYKPWYGSRKIKTSVPTVDIVYALHKNYAPPEMIEKYLDLVDDIERKLQLAKEFRLTKFAADILIKLRDRHRLRELRNSIQTTQFNSDNNSEDHVQRYIDNALNTSTIKWKN